MGKKNACGAGQMLDFFDVSVTKEFFQGHQMTSQLWWILKGREKFQLLTMQNREKPEKDPSLLKYMQFIFIY